MIYVNFDVETTGWIPRKHAMLSLGAVAHVQVTEDFGFPRDEFLSIGEFSINLEIPKDREWDQDTQIWWGTEENAHAYALTRADPMPPFYAMVAFMDWLDALFGKVAVNNLAVEAGLVQAPQIAFVANPAAFDFPFLRDYMTLYIPDRWEPFAEENRCSFGCLDLPTLAASILGVHYSAANRTRWPEHWAPPDAGVHHVAVDDARSQSYSFVQMMKERVKR